MLLSSNTPMASHLREEVQVLKCLQQLHDLTHCHLSALIYFSFLHSLTDSLTLCYSSNTTGKLQRQGHWHFLCSHTLFSMAHSPTSFNSVQIFFLTRDSDVFPPSEYEIYEAKDLYALFTWLSRHPSV